MKILVGGTEITTRKAYAHEHANGKRELRFSIPQSGITYDELKEVLAANTGEIVLTQDNGTTQTFSGYKFTPEITDKTENEEAVFYVVIQCVAEAERRALEAQAKAAALEKTVVEQQETIEMLQETIKMLVATISGLNEQLLAVQMAAADLYEKSLNKENITEEAPEETNEEMNKEELAAEESEVE